MTLTDCQLLSIVAQLGTFAAAAERLHITPSAVSHAVSGVEAECGFPLFTRTKSGVTLTAAAEKLMPAIQQMLASSESLDQSIAQINGMHKGALRLGVFNSACVTWLPKIVPGFRAAFPGIDVQIYQGSYDDITGWLKTGAVELGFLSNSSALDLDFEPLYDDRLICIAPPDYQPRRPTPSRAAPAWCGPRSCAASRSSASSPTWMPISRATLKRTTCMCRADATSWMTRA